MDNRYKIRQSNIELLRILCILMIISFHYVYKGGFYFESITGNFLIVKAFWFLGELGVNLFILIMGYFMINCEFKIKKLLLILLEVLFYHLITILIAYKLDIYDLPKGKEFFLLFFPTILNTYWFVTVYVILYILSPYLNQFVKSFSKCVMKKFLLTVLIIYSVIPTLFGLFYNTTEGLLYYNRLIWLVIIYFIGAYIRLYPESFIRNVKKLIGGG